MGNPGSGAMTVRLAFCVWRFTRGEAEARERRERKAVVNCIVNVV